MPSTHLPVACQARPEGQKKVSITAVFLHFGTGSHPRPQQAGLTSQSLHQLGQFIQAVLGKKASKPSNAWVVAKFEILLKFLEKLTILLESS